MLWQVIKCEIGLEIFAGTGPRRRSRIFAIYPSNFTAPSRLDCALPSPKLRKEWARGSGSTGRFSTKKLIGTLHRITTYDDRISPDERPERLAQYMGISTDELWSRIEKEETA